MLDDVQVWPRYDREGDDALAGQPTERDQAFAGLVTRQARLMFRVAYGLLRNAHDAEDAVQDAFLKLYRTDAWREVRDEKAFLARTVWRVALTLASARSRATEDVAHLELASNAASPEDNAVGGDGADLLRRFIDALPQKLRDVLLLSALDEMSSRDVAVILGIPEVTVRRRLMRAKAELKKRFERKEQS